MIDLFRSKVKPHWSSISIDGSAFDSTQLASLMEITDNVFWQRLQPAIERFMAVDGWNNPNASSTRLVADATKTDLKMFTRIPGCSFPVMPTDMIKEISSFNPKDINEWFCLPLKGTTFSGHPTRTTLGNTFRSLLYMFFYLEEAGLVDPWLSSDSFVVASGDDVVCWCDPKFVEAVHNSILVNSSRDKFGAKGLGQCIKEVKIGKYYDIDFCSKWSFVLNPSDISTWTLCRDYSKTLTTKMYYTKSNDFIHRNPVIHAQALLDCVKSEHSSKLLEDIMSFRVNKCLDGVDINFSDARVKLAYNSVYTHYKQEFYGGTIKSEDYLYEDQINARLGLNYGHLYELYLNLQLRM